VSLPGSFLAAATTSAKDFHGRPGCVHKMCGAVPISRTGSRSFSVSKFMACKDGFTACVSNTISQVAPSGLERATCPVPIDPCAPGLFSTMTVAPSRCCRPACINRESWSTEPPAGNGTMTLTVATGHTGAAVWASGSRGNTPVAAAASEVATKARRDVMNIPLGPERSATQTLIAARRRAGERG